MLNNCNLFSLCKCWFFAPSASSSGQFFLLFTIYVSPIFVRLTQIVKGRKKTKMHTQDRRRTPFLNNGLILLLPAKYPLCQGNATLNTPFHIPYYPRIFTAALLAASRNALLDRCAYRIVTFGS